MAHMRKCIGSAKFGIEAHEAPVGDFPAQPSQKDGLGRMCKPHWTEYTRALRKAGLASKAAGTKLPVGAGTPPVAHGAKRARGAPEPSRTKRVRGRAIGLIIEEADAAIVPEAANVGEASIA